MSTETQTFESIRKLRDALPSLPDDAVILDRDGDKVRRSDVRIVFGNYAPYTVRYESTTPAPLDPSKVKVGDTVTVRVEEFDIPDPYEVTGKAYVGPIGMAVGGFLLSGDRVTLTAHQPAPEPEPLVDGRLYEVTAPDGRRGRAFYKPIDGIRANHPWVSEDETRYRSDAVTDVRPLVVIDPAAVDVVELAKAAWDCWDGQPATESSNAHFRDIVRAVLSKLGLEEAR